MLESIEHEAGITVKIIDNTPDMYKQLRKLLDSGRVVKIELVTESLVNKKIRRLCSEYFLVGRSSRMFQKLHC